MKKGIQEILFIALTILVAGSIIATSFWAFFPYKILTVSQPMPVVNKNLIAGGNVEYVIDYCKKGNYPATITRVLRRVDGDGVGQFYTLFSSDGTTIPAGCGVEVSANNIIPAHVSPGKYIIEVRVDYKVNPIRTVHESFETEIFNIN